MNWLKIYVSISLQTPGWEHSVTFLSLKQNNAYGNYNQQLAEKNPDLVHKLYL